jgi:hypothetical protein
MAGITIDDEELEAHIGEYLRDVVAKHAQWAIEKQAKEVVAGELARLRLLDPNMGTLGDMVEDKLTPLIDARIELIMSYRLKEVLLRIFQDVANR